MDALIRILSSLLIPMFFAGMIGSLLVVVVTVVRDVGEVLAGDDPGNES